MQTALPGSRTAQAQAGSMPATMPGQSRIFAPAPATAQTELVQQRQSAGVQATSSAAPQRHSTGLQTIMPSEMVTEQTDPQAAAGELQVEAVLVEAVQGIAELATSQAAEVSAARQAMQLMLQLLEPAASAADVANATAQTHALQPAPPVMLDTGRQAQVSLPGACT